MTEDEAKARICPMTLGRTPPNPEGCIGSPCNAWRWASPEDGAIVETWNPHVDGAVKVRDHTYDSLPAWRVPNGPDRPGFCGLAGAPQ